jgi:hypothetical protein
VGLLAAMTPCSAGNRWRSSAGTAAGDGGRRRGFSWTGPVESPHRSVAAPASPPHGGAARDRGARQMREARVSPPSGRSGRRPELELTGRRRRPNLLPWRGRRRALGGAGKRRRRAPGGGETAGGVRSTRCAEMGAEQRWFSVLFFQRVHVDSTWGK